MSIDGFPVIDAVVHPYNLSADNAKGQIGPMVREGFYQLHAHWNPPDVQAPRAWFQQDQDVATAMDSFCQESDVDMVVYHTLRLDSLFHDGLCSRAKAQELRAGWPGRSFAYIGLDPTLGVERALDDLDEQLVDLPDAIGIKFYPDQVDPYRTFHMADPEVCFPIYERARERGLRVIAVHKALPNGPVPLAPYRIDDVEGAAMAFPDLSFEIVHAGMAFVDETAYALARFPNVYANLEVTSALLYKAPRLFQEALAMMLFWGGPSKLIWATGANFSHPQIPLHAFWNLELDADLIARYQLPPFDAEMKSLILGRNWATMAGVDLDARMTAVAGDEWDRTRARVGRRAPYSVWAERVGESHADAMSRQAETEASVSAAGFRHDAAAEPAP
ncbi:MAG: amidohydrolase family protein [Ilumatobacter sp.]|uniref:amidohydrolase family protein n=1 Tax=Ilumatobacter sp. TaxID=1967498 RepID=UPI00391B7019